MSVSGLARLDALARSLAALASAPPRASQLLPQVESVARAAQIDLVRADPGGRTVLRVVPSGDGLQVTGTRTPVSAPVRPGVSGQRRARPRPAADVTALVRRRLDAAVPALRQQLRGDLTRRIGR